MLTDAVIIFVAWSGGVVAGLFAGAELYHRRLRRTLGRLEHQNRHPASLAQAELAQIVAELDRDADR